MAEKPASRSISFINIGTKILAKDVMDQFIRSLGNHRTHYAVDGASARRVLKDLKVDVIILENTLVDTSAFRLLQAIKRDTQNRDAYIILAVEENDPKLIHLSQEMEADAILIKPFTAKDLSTQIE